MLRGVRIVKTFIHWLDKALSWWCIVLMGALTIAIILSVFLRYVFGITFVWAEASITMFFVGTTYFGAALGVRENEHISIDYFAERLPQSFQKVIRLFVMLVIIAVQAMLFKTSLTWISKVGSTVDVALNMPKTYFYMMVPVSAILVIFYAVVHIISSLLGNEQDDAPAQGQ